MSEKQLVHANVTEYFEWLDRNLAPDSALCKTAHTYLEEIRTMRDEPADGEKNPFLSVVTRTQGKRPEMLTETLLSLTGQKNTDFELLLMGHNLTEEQNATVRALIEDLPAWMQEKTRLIPVNGGTRTTPLNAGFEAARGQYIAILDDDDLVFDNWVSVFYDAAQEHAGKILHAYTALQDWETVGGGGTDIPRACGTIKNTFCRKYDLPNQLKLNTCPLCGLAFPAAAFRDWGLHFDESLTTTEDWDYLMRCSFLTGVYDCPEVTFLYRNWVNAENSRTQHQPEEWTKNYKKIQARFKKTPILFPPAEVAKLIEPPVERVGAPAAIITEFASDLELFYHNGEGYSEERKKKGKICEDDPKLIEVNDFPAGEKIIGMRIDPYPIGNITVGDLLVRVLTPDGQSFNYTIKNISSNGKVIADHLVFLKNDPQFNIRLPFATEVSRVLIGYDLKLSVCDEVIDLLCSPSPFFYRVRRKIRHILKKILKRV